MSFILAGLAYLFGASRGWILYWAFIGLLLGLMKKELTVKEVASLGGKARAAKLSKKRRKEIAMMGVAARKKKTAKPPRKT